MESHAAANLSIRGFLFAAPSDEGKVLASEEVITGK
jgi:hypothetical protein